MSTPDWPAASARPQPAPQKALVFRFSLDLPEDWMASLRALLSPDEQVRANRLIVPRARTRWIAARGQVREILAACLGADPAGLRFTLNAYGKPALEGEGHLRFNTSHTSGMGLLAVTVDQEVGVDVETIREMIDRENIARRFFATGEVQALFSLPPDQQTRAFYTCWTRKEAYIKARGMGLSLPLDGFEVSLAPGDPPRLIYPSEGWAMYEIAAGEGYAAALVAEGEGTTIEQWDWMP